MYLNISCIDQEVRVEEHQVYGWPIRDGSNALFTWSCSSRSARGLYPSTCFHHVGDRWFMPADDAIFAVRKAILL
jgi:hypothetical protein